MAQRQFAEQADDQIQGNREDDINGNGDQHIGELTAGTSGIHKVRDNRIDHGNHAGGALPRRQDGRHPLLLR